MDQSMFAGRSWTVDFRLPTEMIPWKLYDKLPRMYEHTTGPFFLEGISKIKFDIAWHSRYQTVFPHTRSFRMMRAITQNDLEEVQKVVKELRRAGVSIDSVIDKKYGLNAIQYAATCNKFPVVQYLLMNGADPDSKNKFGFTPLMFATMHNHLETVHTLTKNGCNVTTKDKYGRTALDKAKDRGFDPLYEFLVEQDKKKIKRSLPPFKIRMPLLSRYFNNELWDIINEHKVFTGKVVLSPFNTLRGLYSISFTNYRTVGKLDENSV